MEKDQQESLCTPGTDVDIDFEKVKSHCTQSSSETYHSDDWVKAEIIVYNDSIAHHIINGKTVLTYTNLRYGDDGRLPENMLNMKDKSYLRATYLCNLKVTL